MVNNNWQYQTHLKARSLFEELSDVISLAPSEEAKRQFLADPNNLYLKKLNDLYAEEYQLSLLKDKSDIIVHAMGCGKTNTSMLSIINWINNTTHDGFKKISSAYYSHFMNERDAKNISKKINFDFNGFAPGSSFLGFNVNESVFDGEQIDFDTVNKGEFSTPVEVIRMTIQALALVPDFIVNDEVDKKALNELIDDPILRDVALQVAFNLSPSKKNKLDEMELFDSRNHKGVLNNYTRTVIKKAINNPLSNVTKKGVFIGEVREMDLDAHRFDLRNIVNTSEVKTIKCYSPKPLLNRNLLGQFVSVAGNYETNAHGKPRLMLVESIELKEKPQQEMKL